MVFVYCVLISVHCYSLSDEDGDCLWNSKDVDAGAIRTLSDLFSQC